jgi:hypothetical protein
MAETVIRMQHGVRMSGGPRRPEGLRRRRRIHQTDIHIQRAGIDSCQIHGDPGKQHDHNETKQATTFHVGSWRGKRDPGPAERAPKPESRYYVLRYFFGAGMMAS